MEDIQQPKSSSKKKTAIIVFTAIAILAVIIAYFYTQYKATHIKTDDAFIGGFPGKTRKGANRTGYRGPSVATAKF